MLMDRGVKFHIPQNGSGALQWNSVPAFSQTTDVECEKAPKPKYKMAPNSMLI